MKRILLFLICSFLNALAAGPIVSIIGTDDNPHPLIDELIEHPVMQRMKEIDQSGVARYFQNLPDFPRFDHCVGVYMLLQRFNAPFDACVAGLLHDVSHTVFSHVADYLFRGKDGEHSYQDGIHLGFLKQHEVDRMLLPHAFSLNDIDPDRFIILEKPLPELCADRIEYNLHTGYLWGVISQEEIEEILQDLRYENGTWYFQSRTQARRFADLPLHFNVTLWGESGNLILYHWTSQALRRAMDIGEISMEQIHFSTDRVVLDKLMASNDAVIKSYMQRCSSFQDYYVETSPEEADVYIPIKFRGIDPLVKTEQGLGRLTDLDPEFAKQWNEVKLFAQKGCHLGTFSEFE